MKKQMRLIFLTFVLIIISQNTYSQNKGESLKILEGMWLGNLEIQGTQLRLVIRIGYEDDSLQAFIDSPDQGAKNIPVTWIEFQNDTLKLKSKLA